MGCENFRSRHQNILGGNESNRAVGAGHEVSSNPQCSSPSVVPDYRTVPYGVPAAKQIRIKSEWWHRCFLATHTAIRTKKILISNTKSKTRWCVDEKHVSSLEVLVPVNSHREPGDVASHSALLPLRHGIYGNECMKAWTIGKCVHASFL